ncbi:MAG TPA: helix-turn-helix domain-containing protein [Pirellulaceae bacterium]|nr:helix-turn-helix domain-containing protein [Pirellulaceae bacterium]
MELRAQRLAREAAEKVPPQSDEHAAPQIVIPSSSEMEARRRRGRPKVINEEMRHKIVALLGAGASLTQTAAFVGVGRNTITRALESDEEFAQQVHEARQRVSLFPLNCLLREAVKNWRAAAWLLGYLDRKEHQERTRRQRVFDAADEQIDRDLVQEMREQARRQRQAEASRAGDGEQPPTSARQPRQKQPRSTRLTTDSSPSMSQGDSDV